VSHRPHPLEQAEIRFGAAGGVLTLAVLAARVAELGEGRVVVLVLGVTAALGATVGPGRSTVLGLTAWALVTGFVTNRYGLLTFTDADLLLMAALVAAALAGSAAARHPVHPVHPVHPHHPTHRARARHRVRSSYGRTE
jgi:hypothetical protein